MRLLDARRLPGPNLLFSVPAAVLDVECDAEESAKIPAAWQKYVVAMTSALDWPQPEMRWLALNGGLSLAFTVEIDRLYAAAEVNEWCFSAGGGRDAHPGSRAGL